MDATIQDAGGPSKEVCERIFDIQMQVTWLLLLNLINLVYYVIIKNELGLKEKKKADLKRFYSI